MEPCAPGTEDEPPIMFSTLNKQENEQERLLKQKAILRNGRYENVFELSYVNGSEHWFCKVCECPVMGRVFQHEVGRRHTQNLSNTNRHLDRPSKEEAPVEEEEIISVAPGEPVPPGFEDELSRVAQIQERLDGFKAGPLVALEYLLELQDYDPTKEPLYLCILCDKRGDPRTVLTHLASYNHITQYLQKHFPSCYRSLAPYMTKQYKRNWQVTLQKIAEGIEKKFGRLSPFPIDKDKFEKDRLHYLTLIGKGKHFSEQSGHTFEELVVHDELTKTHEDERSYENSSSNNWGGSNSIQKSFKKRSPSPPVVAVPLVKKMKENVKSKSQSAHQTSEPSTQKPSLTRKRSLSSVSSVSSNDLDDNNSQRREQGGHRYHRSPIRGRQLPYSRRKSPSKRRYSPIGRRRSPGSRRQSPFGRRSPFARRSSPVGRRTSPAARRSPVGRRFSPSTRRQSPPVRRGRSPGYQRKSRGEDKKMGENEKLQKIEEFRKLCKAIENDLQNVMKQHEKNPERHPQYNDEWKKFWNRRYKELQDQGVDTAKYDFKPEWIQFWNRRMTELHNEELKSRKEALRRRLGLDEITPIKFKIGHTPESSHQGTKPNLPMAAQPDQDTEVIIIDDKDDEKSVNRSSSPWEKDPSPRPRSTRRRSKEKPALKEKSSRTRKRSHSKETSPISKVSKEYSPRRDGKRISRSKDISPSRDELRKRDLDLREMRSRSREKTRESKRSEYRESSFERDMRGKERIRTIADLPWERDKVFRNMYEDYYKPPSVLRDVSRGPVDTISLLPPEVEEDAGEVNVVDVLRILTALEERLGSLGPRVVDLLAQALAMEKKEANSSDMLLDNDVNCVLFETIKEKLKGQLLTGLVDMVQERAFKKAIKKIASLIHQAGQRKKQREKTTSKMNAVTVPGVGNVDRAAIAKQIANALIMQGKTDVSQAELEQLINAVVGMAEASKNANKPMTTANFLQQFSNNASKPQTSLSNTAHTASKKPDLSSIVTLTEPLTPSPEKNSTKEMENLSDSDLQTLLQNFKDLSTDEQHNLISYLKKLEYQEPERVEKLRQFVNLEAGSKLKEEIILDLKDGARRDRRSPFSNRSGGINPTSDLVNIESDDDDDLCEERNNKVQEEKEKVTVHQKIHLDSDEEDYTFDDVVKTATKTMKDKELESNMKIVKESMKFDSSKSTDQDLATAKDVISNLMSNINKHNSPLKSGVDLLGLGGGSTATPTNILTSTADFAKTFNNINIDSLANIVSTVKNLSSTDSQLKYEPAPQNLGFELPSSSNRQPESLAFRFERPKDSEDSFVGPSGNSASFYNRGPARDYPRGVPYQPNRFPPPRNRNPAFQEEKYTNNPISQQNIRGPRPSSHMNQWNTQRFGGYNDFNRPSGNYNRW